MRLELIYMKKAECTTLPANAPRQFSDTINLYSIVLVVRFGLERIGCMDKMLICKSPKRIIRVIET
jgi:hypothetical protein